MYSLSFVLSILSVICSFILVAYLYQMSSINYGSKKLNRHSKIETNNEKGSSLIVVTYHQVSWHTNHCYALNDMIWRILASQI